MSPLLQDFAKEGMLLLMGAVVGVIRHKVKQVIKDVNAFFTKFRQLEARVAELEQGCSAKAASLPHQESTHEPDDRKSCNTACRNGD